MNKPAKLTDSQEEILVVAVRRGGVVETTNLRIASLEALLKAKMIEYRVTRKGRRVVKQLNEVAEGLGDETIEE